MIWFKDNNSHLDITVHARERYRDTVALCQFLISMMKKELKENDSMVGVGVAMFWIFIIFVSYYKGWLPLDGCSTIRVKVGLEWIQISMRGYVKSTLPYFFVRRFLDPMERGDSTFSCILKVPFYIHHKKPSNKRYKDKSLEGTEQLSKKPRDRFAHPVSSFAGTRS